MEKKKGKYATQRKISKTKKRRKIKLKKRPL